MTARKAVALATLALIALASFAAWLVGVPSPIVAVFAVVAALIAVLRGRVRKRPLEQSGTAPPK